MDAPILETKRLILRAFNDADLETLADAIFSDPAVMLTLPQDPKTDEEFKLCSRNYIDTYTALWASEERGGWAVCSRAPELGRPGTLLGFCGFELGHVRDYGLELEFGYTQSCWGKGVSLEAATACRDWFLNQEKWTRFYACHFPGNKGSERIIRRNRHDVQS